jgi:hypothetical protein
MKGWKKRRLMKKSACARGSFRYVGKKGAKTRVLICCPRGHYSKKADRCEVGTRAYEILRRA